MNGEVQEHLENTSRFVASSCGTPGALRQEQRTRGIAAGSRPVTAPGRAAHQSPWQESVPRLPEPGNDRGTSSTLSQGVLELLLWPRFLPGARQELALPPQLSCLPVPAPDREMGLQSPALRGLNRWGVSAVRATQEMPGK